MNNDILVSVCVVTYNQEKYIAECIESIVNQDCNFTYEIIISDDASDDSTHNIIKKYQAKYPELIFPILRSTNVGATKNILESYKKARGKYIAHMDGDDVFYPEKLKVQVGLLEENLDCFISSHAVNKIDSNSKDIFKDSGVNISGIKDYFYLLQTPSFFAHSSKMFRNTLESSWYDQIKSEIYDFELHLLHAKNGNIIHTSDILGAYRINTGLSSKGKKVNKNMVSAKFELYEFHISQYHGEAKVDLRRAYATSAFNYAKGSLLLGDIKGFKTYIAKSVTIKNIGLKQNIAYIISIFPNRLIKILKIFKR